MPSNLPLRRYSCSPSIHVQEENHPKPHVFALPGFPMDILLILCNVFARGHACKPILFARSLPLQVVKMVKIGEKGPVFLWICPIVVVIGSNDCHNDGIRSHIWQTARGREVLFWNACFLRIISVGLVQLHLQIGGVRHNLLFCLCGWLW